MKSTVMLVKNVDFILDRIGKNIIFNADPFANSAFATQAVFSEGVEDDTELMMWLFKARFDTKLLFTHFGYILGAELASAQAYKDVINATFDGIAGGTALEQVEELVSAMTGIPLVKESGEEVEDIRSDGDRLLVITDKNVYKYAVDHTAAVAVGDTVQAGDALVSEWELMPFNRGVLSANLKALTLDAGMLAPEFAGEITFENTTVDVVVEGAAGSEKVSWALGGHPLDVDRFWEVVHERRLVYGKSLHELLDEQPGGVPATINPLEFLIQNVLRNNAIAIRVQGFGPEAIGLGPSLFLRRLVPPHQIVFLVFELPTMEDAVTMEEVVESDMATFDAMPPMTDTVGDTNIGEAFTVKIQQFTCN
jgi:hypothetical protein